VASFRYPFWYLSGRIWGKRLNPVRSVGRDSNRVSTCCKACSAISSSRLSVLLEFRISTHESFSARLYIHCVVVELATVDLHSTLSTGVCSVSTEDT
jgi:hypothetical protein